ASRQFTKTVFSDEDYESTAINRLPTAASQPEQAFGKESSEADTGEVIAAPEPEVPAEAPPVPEYNSMLDPLRKHLESEPASRIVTREEKAPAAADWVSRVLVGLILAGLILLVLLLFVQT